MKTITTAIVCLLIQFFVFAQSEKSKLSDSCSSSYLNNVFYFWKLDSLGNNGYRLNTYKNILDCKSLQKSIDYVFEKLGKPNKVSEDNSGVYYYYYYLDGLSMPKEANLPTFTYYICFKIKNKNSNVEHVFKGHFD